MNLWKRLRGASKSNTMDIPRLLFVGRDPKSGNTASATKSLENSLFMLIAIILGGPVSAHVEDIHRLAARRIIDPPASVGGIFRESTEQDLLMIYGGQNVKRSDIDVGEGESVEGNTIYPNTKASVDIEWKNSISHPERITISAEGTTWQTREGITIGTTAEELETLNGRPFKLTGFAWDYEGRTVSWEGGNLPKELQIDLKPTRDVSDKEYEMVLGDGYFSSDHAVMKKLKIGC